jgi:hypothetical protein
MITVGLISGYMNWRGVTGMVSSLAYPTSRFSAPALELS